MRHFYQAVCLGFFIAGAALPVGVAAQRLLYVDAGAAGANDGSAWADAFTDLQDALAAAMPGDEIWVAEGVYKPIIPDDAANVTDAERNVSFQLGDGVALYGGFAGNEASRDERDAQAHATILSGDLLDNDNGAVDVDEPTRAENSYHVIEAGPVLEAPTVLDGFTITGGNANTLPPKLDDKGGGLYLIGGQDAMGQLSFPQPTIANVVFIANSARFGGGMGVTFAGPRLSNVVFIGNVAVMNGGGLHNTVSGPTIANVLFRDNESGNFGGGMMNERGSAFMHDVTFIGNVGVRGGGLYNLLDNTLVVNARFHGNVATVSGGGMYNDESPVAVMNAVFSGNRTLDPDLRGGGGMSNFRQSPFLTNLVFYGNTSARDGGAVFNINSSPTIVNSILWGNTADGLEDAIFSGGNPGASALLFTSLIEGGIPPNTSNQGGNLDEDPRFVDADGPDDVPGTEDDDLRLMAGSPAIDAGLFEGLLFDVLDLDEDGDTEERVPIDLDGHLRIFNGGTGAEIVDMGAYEFGAPGIGVAVEETIAEELPEAPIFLAAYPNPFRGQATLRYALPAAGPVVLKVYDVQGREVATLVDSTLPAGMHEVRFEAPHLASGLYLYHLEAAGHTATRTMMLVK